MPISYVATKFYQPTPRSEEVSRDRLFLRLDRYLSGGCPFFLVSAPPGFGKTTLVSAWTRNTHLPAAWLSLEKADNEPFRFWRYIIAALKTILPDLNSDLEAVLNSPQTLTADFFLPLLLNYLAACRKTFFLVLDDYHLIETPEIHETFEMFLDHLPVDGHVVLVTRSDPPLHLARRRSLGQLCEVRVADLRFNSDEAGEFFHRSMQLDLSLEDVALLELRTEGWVTGLQLAAISLRDLEDPQAFITAFHGEDRFITDYLVEEVLLRQPEHIQQFLMETSLLQRFNAQLCNAISLRNDSNLILSLLEVNNLFLIPLDTQREWFRFHHLFARLLNKKLELAFGTEAINAILHRASEESIRQGLLVEGVQYLLDSGDLEGTAALIFRLSHELFHQNELPLLMHWASQLPEKIIAYQPGLCIALSWAAHATGRPELCHRYMDWVERYCGLTVEKFLSLALEEQHRLPADVLGCLIEAVVIKLRLLIDEGITRETLEHYLQMLPWLIPERDGVPYANNSPSAMRPIMLFQAGLAYHLLGQLKLAAQLFEELIVLSRQQRNHFLVALGMGYLGQIQAAQGHLSLAESTWRDVLTYAKENGVDRDAFFSMAYIGLGSLAYERNDLELAERLLREGINLARSWAAWQGLVPGYTALALTLQAKGDMQGAIEALDILKRYQQSAPQMILPAETACRALVWSRQGKPELGIASMQKLKVHGLPQDLIFAEVLTAANDLDEAVVLLERLAKESEEAGMEGYLVRIMALKAKVLLTKNQQDLAQNAIEKALLLGEKEGYLRAFLDLGEAIVLLLRRVDLPNLTDYRAKLLKAFSQAGLSPGSVSEQVNAGLPEPLTNREMEILLRIAQGADNAALAVEYTISIKTVKKHISHLFEKLDVVNRFQAVEKARRLGLLP